MPPASKSDVLFLAALCNAYTDQKHDTLFDTGEGNKNSVLFFYHLKDSKNDLAYETLVLKTVSSEDLDKPVQMHSLAKPLLSLYTEYDSR